MVFKNFYYLIFYFVFSILFYFNFALFEFFFLVPIFLFLFNQKKFNLKEIFYFSVFIFILSIINLYYLSGYGFIFMLILGFANILFYLIFYLISQKLFFKKYYLFTISSVFLILYYILSFTILNNFWINYLVFLKYFPISILYLGEFFNLFLLILFNLIIFDFIKYYLKYKKNFLKKIPKLNYIILIILILNFFIFNSYFFQKDYSQNDTIKISGIQGNLNQSWQERNLNYEKNLNLYLNLSKKSISNFSPQIIIWPEYTFTHLLELDLITQNKLKNFSNNNNLTLIVGAIKLNNLNSNYSKRFDSLYIFDKQKNPQIYNSFEPVTLFDKDVIPAKKNSIIKFNNSIFLGLSICYEEYFSYIYSNLINTINPPFFILTGNLYYIKSKFGQEIISLVSNLRAFENNRYFVRVETSGISKIIDNNGRVVKKIPVFEKGFLNYNVPIIKDKTFYSKYLKEIDFIEFLISIFLIWFLVLKKNKNKKIFLKF